MNTPVKQFGRSRVESFTVENEGGTEEWFCIKCFSGKQRGDYMRELSKGSKMKTNEDGTASFEFSEGYKDLSIMLLSRCVHVYDEQSEKVGDLLGEKTLHTWDSVILDELVPLANDVCKLNVEADEQVKNG